MASALHSLFIEISPGSLRYIEASKADSGEVLVHAAKHFPFEGASKTKIAEILKQAAGAGQLNVAAASIWSSAIIVRRITMPLMADRELKGAIGFEAEKHIPYPVNECVLDYITLRKMQASKQMELMLIVAKKDFINEKRQIAEEAGIALNFIDIHPFALSNAYAAARPDAAGGTVSLVHLGDMERAMFTGLNFVSIMKGGQPQLVRDLGQDTTPGLDGKPSPEAVNQISEKIRGSVEFYENSTEEEITDLYVSGQGAALAEVLDAVAKATEKKVNSWTCSDKVKFEAKEAEELIKKQEKEFLVCLGLAVRGLKS